MPGSGVGSAAMGRCSRSIRSPATSSTTRYTTSPTSEAATPACAPDLSRAFHNGWAISSSFQVTLLHCGQPNSKRGMQMDQPSQPQPTTSTATIEAADRLERAIFEAKRVLVGQDHMIEQLFVAWLARGHC